MRALTLSSTWEGGGGRVGVAGVGWNVRFAHCDTFIADYHLLFTGNSTYTLATKPEKPPTPRVDSARWNHEFIQKCDLPTGNSQELLQNLPQAYHNVVL